MSIETNDAGGTIHAYYRGVGSVFVVAKYGGGERSRVFPMVSRRGGYEPAICDRDLRGSQNQGEHGPDGVGRIARCCSSLTAWQQTGDQAADDCRVEKGAHEVVPSAVYIQGTEQHIGGDSAQPVCPVRPQEPQGRRRGEAQRGQGK